jgi:hypothetical protein
MFLIATFKMRHKLRIYNIKFNLKFGLKINKSNRLSFHVTVGKFVQSTCLYKKNRKKINAGPC